MKFNIGEEKCNCYMRNFGEADRYFCEQEIKIKFFLK